MSGTNFPTEETPAHFVKPDSPAALELQRISNLFQSPVHISEAEFVMNCKSVMNLLQYSRSDTVVPQEQELIVDVIEELVAPTSLLHPISPPMLMSLLEYADAFVGQVGDFILQLRMASARLLIEDNKDVALAFSLCQMLPNIRPSSQWQPVMNSLKINPVCNLHGSISLPEIHPTAFLSEGSSLDDCSPSSGSPIPSLSSLLNCTSSSSTSVRHFDNAYDPNHVNVITESVSQPVISLSARSSLPASLSAPHLGNTVTHDPEEAILPPFIAAKEIIPEHGNAPEIIFSPSIFSPDLFDEVVSPTMNDPVVLAMPDIRVELASSGDTSVSSGGHRPFAEMALTSQDDLTQMIFRSEFNDLSPSPSSFSVPDQDTSLGSQNDFSISIGPPRTEADLPYLGSGEPLPLSAIPNQASSPLSPSPSPIAFIDDTDIFRNIFEIDVQKRPPSPYNKRLRSASNTPQPTTARTSKPTRAVSASTRCQGPLDLDSTALTLPPPANPRPNNSNRQPTTKIREKSKRVVSAPVRSRRKVAPIDPDLALLPPPPGPTTTFEARGRKFRTQTIRDIDGEDNDGGNELAQGFRSRSRRSASASVNKENI
ncbi:hypothetical protein H0H92_009571 [Tricholoma furcatifolium]|nr:hypothetical protein H0H92_009571 [Tricholoma furcatifolium]